MRIELKRPRGRAPDAGDLHRRRSFPALALHQNAQVLARHLHRLFSKPGILVAEHLDFGAIAGVGVLPPGNVQPALPVLRDGQIHGDFVLPGIEKLLQRARRRRGVGSGNIEQQSVGKNAGGCRYGKKPGIQQLLIDEQATKSPGAKGQRVQLKLQRALEKAVLQLHVLWAEKRALGPDHRLQPLHSHQVIRPAWRTQSTRLQWMYNNST